MASVTWLVSVGTSVSGRPCGSILTFVVNENDVLPA